MIPRPSVETMLAQHNGDRAAAREALRALVQERGYRAAEFAAQKAGLSPYCEASLHAPHGCRNDGSRCLCECHDAPSEAVE